jgi:hypothetical protein
MQTQELTYLNNSLEFDLAQKCLLFRIDSEVWDERINALIG